MDAASLSTSETDLPGPWEPGSTLAELHAHATRARVARGETRAAASLHAIADVAGLDRHHARIAGRLPAEPQGRTPA